MNTTSVFARALAGLLLAAAGGAASARPLEEIARTRRLVLCAHPDALPWSARDGDRPGWVVELARAMAEARSWQMDVTWTPDTLAVRRSSCDLYLVSADEDDDPPRGDGVLPLRRSRALVSMETVLAQPASAAPIGRLERDTAKVAVPSGSWGHLQLLRRGVRLAVRHMDDDAILDAVRAGDVDAGIVSAPGLAWYRLRHPDAVLQAHAAPVADLGLDFGLALGLRQSDAAMAREVDTLLRELDARGVLATIGRRYGVTLRSP